jgi:hypothetical protein
VKGYGRLIKADLLRCFTTDFAYMIDIIRMYRGLQILQSRFRTSTAIIKHHALVVSEMPCIIALVSPFQAVDLIELCIMHGYII